MEEVPVDEAKPHKPRQRDAEKHQQVQRRQQPPPHAAPAFDAVKNEQHQRRNQETDRPFHQRRQTGRRGPEQVPVPPGFAFGFLRQIAGKNRAADEKGERHVEDDRARIHYEERHGHDHDGRQQAAAGPVNFPAEGEDQGRQRQAKSGGRDARRGFIVAKGREGEGHGLEIERRLVQIVHAVVGGHQPGARLLHFAGDLGISPLIRLQEGQTPQPETEGKPGHDQSQPKPCGFRRRS